MLIRVLASALLAASLMSCASTSPTFSDNSAKAVAPVEWTPVDRIDVVAINSDLQAGVPTVDIGLYYPANLDDQAVEVLPLDGLIAEFINAKEVFEPAGIQLKLLWVKTGVVDPSYLAINASRSEAEMPSGGYGNMYEQRSRHPSTLPDETLEAFNAIIEPAENNHRTVYLVALENVYMTYYEDLDNGRNWAPKVVNTYGLSFPSYVYGEGMPDRIRGAITLTRHDVINRLTIAHELGHKLINVSHEYMAISPQHEIRSDDGLMLYGPGTHIGSGKEGRWHQERLLLSPYLYRLDGSGNRIWNPDYQAGGFYYDPIYKEYTVEFD